MTIQLPDTFKGQLPAAGFRNQPTESLSEGIASGYGVIGYKGKNWSLRYKGEKYAFTRPDDGSPSNYIDVIILRHAHSKSKSYYPDYNQDNEGKRPLCASLNGDVPDRDVQQKQSDSCAICPRNEWRTSADGRRSRECSDYKRLAVLLMPDVSKRMLGNSLSEAVFLRVPGASLNDLAMFGDSMASQGFPYYSLVTRISFLAEKSHPQMKFAPLFPLTDKEQPLISALRDEVLTRRITGEDTSGAGLTAAPLPPRTESKQITAAVIPLHGGGAKAAPVAGGIDIDTDVADAPAPTPAAPPAQADSALDARLAGLMKSHGLKF